MFLEFNSKQNNTKNRKKASDNNKHSSDDRLLTQSSQPVYREEHTTAGCGRERETHSPFKNRNRRTRRRRMSKPNCWLRPRHRNQRSVVVAVEYVLLCSMFFCDFFGGRIFNMKIINTTDNLIIFRTENSVVASFVCRSSSLFFFRVPLLVFDPPAGRKS